MNISGSYWYIVDILGFCIYINAVNYNQKDIKSKRYKKTICSFGATGWQTILKLDALDDNTSTRQVFIERRK